MEPDNHIYKKNNVILVGFRKAEGREEIKEACVCIGGFLQPVPFVQKHYSTIYECGDGFADRILLCTPKPKLLKEDEVEEWVTKLEATGLTSLEQVYSLIQDWHTGDEEIVYTFDDEAKAVYKEFADKIVDLMNEKWETPEQCGNIGNASKDRRTMIRYYNNFVTSTNMHGHIVRQFQSVRRSICH